MATSSASNGVQRSRRVPTDIHIAATRRSLRSTDGNAKGYASNKDKRITLSDSLAFADRAAVLIHEIGHCVLHFGESKPNLKQRELEAEATCFVVASHFGLNRESKFYLASYGVYWKPARPPNDCRADYFQCAENAQQETAAAECNRDIATSIGHCIDGYGVGAMSTAFNSPLTTCFRLLGN